MSPLGSSGLFVLRVLYTRGISIPEADRFVALASRPLPNCVHVKESSPLLPDWADHLHVSVPLRVLDFEAEGVFARFLDRHPDMQSYFILTPLHASSTEQTDVSDLARVCAQTRNMRLRVWPA